MSETALLPTPVADVDLERNATVSQRTQQDSDAVIPVMSAADPQAVAGDVAVLGHRMAGLVGAVGGASASLRRENVSAEDRATLEGILDRSVAALGVIALSLAQGRVPELETP